MFYTVYKITNIVNGKIYIGKHQTQILNDGYLGSGKLLNRAIKKYGIENFEKEILFQLANEIEMNLKEKELVTEKFCSRKDTYNLCPGGKGGFGYINRFITEEQKAHRSRKGLDSQIKSGINNERLKKARDILREKIADNGGIWWDTASFKGKKHTRETKEKISNTNRQNKISLGQNNSQYGTCWITNGQETCKIEKNSFIPNGWFKGRTLRNKK